MRMEKRLKMGDTAFQYRRNANAKSPMLKQHMGDIEKTLALSSQMQSVCSTYSRNSNPYINHVTCKLDLFA